MSWATNFTITISDVEQYQPDIRNRMTSGSINNIISGSKAIVEDEVLRPIVWTKYKQAGKTIPNDLPGGEGSELDEIMPAAYPQIRRKMIFHVLMSFYRIVNRSDKDAEKMGEYEEKYANAGLSMLTFYIDVNDNDALDASEATSYQDQLDDRIR